MGRAIWRTVLGLVTAAAVVLLAPIASASPETDAYDAITAAWEAAGGTSSALGAPSGDVYPVGVGFAQDFGGGKMFFTSATGARALYGAILDKYESLGGPADSNLGFPNIDEVPGLVSPDSRVTTFSADDQPVIFWTPEHGAFVVRDAINSAWDKLGSSGGALGVPVEDEFYDGNVLTQKFSGGQLSWNRMTKAFTTVPPGLAAQLSDLQVPTNPAADIARAWRATGGARGPLGAQQGGQYPLGKDGVGQDYADGEVLFTPATGANALYGDILAKYKSLGGPLGSDLGFPISNEVDGGVAPDSRTSAFSGADKPVIFWTSDHGAFVVRGALKAAWDKLGGPTGELGIPLGDQAVDGDTVTQKFSGGTIAWNRVKNVFSTEPSKLASSLSGLQIPGQNLPNAPSNRGATSSADNGFASHWWWLLVILAVLLVIVIVALLLRRRRRRRTPEQHPVGSADQGNHGAAASDLQGLWSLDTESNADSVRFADRYTEPAEHPPFETAQPVQATPNLRWKGRTDPSVVVPDASTKDAFTTDTPSGGRVHGGSDDPITAPTRISSETEANTGRHAVVGVADVEWPSDWRSVGPKSPPTIHLPLPDPRQAPEGYPVKGNVRSGLYCTPGSALYDKVPAEIWFASEEAAQANGFDKSV